MPHKAQQIAFVQHTARRLKNNRNAKNFIALIVNVRFDYDAVNFGVREPFRQQTHNDSFEASVRHG